MNDTCCPSALKNQWQIKTEPHYSSAVCTIDGFTERTPVELDFKENNTSVGSKCLLAVSCYHLLSGGICIHYDWYSFNLVKVREQAVSKIILPISCFHGGQLQFKCLTASINLTFLLVAVDLVPIYVQAYII